MPFLSAFSGPLLGLLIVGSVAASLWRATELFGVSFSPSANQVALAALVLYLLVGYKVQHQVGLTGDEPHYMLIAHSVLQDHDLEVADDYAEGSFRAFYDGKIGPHLAHGTPYSVHGVGLPLILLPGYALLGLTSGAIVDKLVYTYTNPVKDGLVRDYRSWPGFNTRPGDWRKGTRTVERPNVYFKHTPKELTYAIVPPPQLAGDLEQQIADVEQQIRDAQRQAAANLSTEGRSFMGAKAIMRTSPFEAPDAPHPVGSLAPRLAAGGDRKAMGVAATALKLFRIAYREAWRAFKDGIDVVFPGGTLLMARRHRVRCEPLDACWCQLAVT